MPEQHHTASHRTKYEFPAQLFVIYDIIIARLSIFFFTLKAKLQFRALGCHIGHNFQTDGAMVIRVRKRGAIRIGNNFKNNSRFRANLVGMSGPTLFQCLGEGKVEIGDNSGCSSTVFSSRASIRIGDNVKIGGNVRIFDHDYHSLDAVARRTYATDQAGCASSPVVIGDDVFIGSNAIVLKGVSVGDRTIIGAGAVVSIKQIPPDSVVAGNPARIITSLRPA